MADNNRDIVLRLHREGYSIIPSGRGHEGKSPSVTSWKPYQEQQPTEQQVNGWLLVTKPSLWGIVTGKGSGVVVIDEDAEADPTVMADLDPQIETPHGRHFWFEYPDHHVKTCTGIVPGIDIRGDGGFANFVGVNPKSHGEYRIRIMPTRDKLYRWEQMPRPVLDAMDAPKRAETKRREVSEPITAGTRDAVMTSIAGAARREGANEEEIKALLNKVLDRVEQPAGDEKTAEDVERIAKSVSRYLPALSTHLTDTGNAEYMAKLYGDIVRYDHSQKRWLVWNGNYWQPDRDGFLSRLAVTAAKMRYMAAAELSDTKEREASAKWAIASESKMRVEAALTLAKSFKPFADDGRNWDIDTMLLGCENGVVDLHTGTLRPGQPEDRVTMTTGLNYDPEATCPRWELFVGEVFDFNEELIDWLRRVLGYSISGDGTEHIFLMGYGEGANGKTRFLNAICSALGDYAHISPFSTFTLPAQSSTNDLRALDKKRFVTASETNEGTKLNTERVNALSGEDPLSARYLYREFETFTPHCKLWLFVNHMPDIKDDTIATWRRIRLIPFTQTFIKEKADSKLGEKLRAEKQGILTWLVQGCLEWQRRGLKEVPQCIRTATGEYRKETDTFLNFLNERCLKEEGASTSSDMLYRAYRSWVLEEGNKPISRAMFGRKMGERFNRRQDKFGRSTYEGVRLLGSGAFVWMDV